MLLIINYFEQVKIKKNHSPSPKYQSLSQYNTVYIFAKVIGKLSNY